MTLGRVKGLLVAVFGLFFLSGNGQQKPATNHPIEADSPAGESKEGKKNFDASEVIFGHVLDAHQFHFFSYKGSDGSQHHAVIPLPVLVYCKQKGFSAFSSARFHHGQESYGGYRLINNGYREKLKQAGYSDEQLKAYPNERIICVNQDGLPDTNIKVYDFSITRNVLQMFLALILLIWVLVGIAQKYAKGNGVTSAPSGFQNAVEPIITFVRDDIAQPNLGGKYKKYMPYLLTVFFFILINNIVGLIPGTANVTGNIAFTLVLGLISFAVILLSSNAHYWGHIFNPPVPGGVKPIMIPVEILGIFTKPIALIVRLFANMIAGHIIIICLISLIFIFGNLSSGVGWAFSPISIAFTVFIYFIEILVAFLQAYIFTALTAVFIGQAFEGGHQDKNHPEDAVIV